MYGGLLEESTVCGMPKIFADELNTHAAMELLFKDDSKIGIQAANSSTLEASARDIEEKTAMIGVGQRRGCQH